jgi:4-hydroxybenzoyl-CoA reductase subunit alpha
MFPSEFCSALLSRKTAKPVRIEYSRDEDFIATRRRHPFITELRTGVKKDGTLAAVECRNLLEGGAYTSTGGIPTMISGTFPFATYRIPNYRYLGRRVYTNTMPSGAMRGHGAPQGFFAFESQLDLIAEELGMDPAELRSKNATQPGDEIPKMAKLSTCGLGECIERAVEGAGWRGRQGQLPDGRGIGMACYSHISGINFAWFGTKTKAPYYEVTVTVKPDGIINLLTQAADIGQGSDTILSQIVAEELGVYLDEVRIIASDTEAAPADMGSISSRVTLMAGNAARAAAADAKRQLFEAAAEKLGLGLQEKLEARDRRIYVRGFPERGLSFSEAVLAAQKARDGMLIIGRGSYIPEGELASPAWSFGAQIAEVEVNRETGRVKVLKSAVAHDCGRAINPMAVEGQLEGSMHMGLGYALSEELLIEEGAILNPSFLDYKILLPDEMPEIESIVVETDDPEGPFGAKEAGEGLILPVAPAIANAIYDAIGVRIKELPITPEKILRALKEKETR